MKLYYGDYLYPENECEIGIAQTSKYGQYGQKIGYTVRWTIRGRLSADTPELLTVAITALEQAQVDGRNLLLYTNSGAASSHGIFSGNTVGGVKAESLNYPNGVGAEYSTFRTFEVTYTAEISLPEGGGQVSYNETLQFTGGGPRFSFIECIQGPPYKTVDCQQTSYKASQSGSATGLGNWPNFPPPAFPEHEHIDRRVQARMTPQYNNGGATQFQINWSYEFEAAQSMTGNPAGPQ